LKDDWELLQNLMLECLSSLPLPDFRLVMSDCSYSWCAVTVFGSSPYWPCFSTDT